MNRHIPGWGLGVFAALSLAPRANALPDLVSAVPPAGWTYPALPRSSGDATSGSCVLQAPALPGASTWFNGSMQNIGNTTASNVYTALYLDDALQTIQGAYTLPASGFARYINYASSVVLMGGRHTLLSRADAFGGVVEGNENNNDWTRQYIWSALALTPGVPVTRPVGPPQVTTGSVPYINCDGFSGTFTAGNWWYAFAVMPAAGSDYDVTLHTETPSNVPQAGFGARTAGSFTLGNHLDAVIINKNLAPSQQTYYAGVSEYSGTGNKVVQFESSPFGTLSNAGVFGPYTMGPGDMIDLQEIFGFTSSPVSIEIVPLAGAANVGVSLIGQIAGGMSTIYDTVPGGFSDGAPAGATEGMVVSLTPNDYHGLIIFKDGPADLNQSCTYDIVIRTNTNLVSNATSPGWSGPIVPRNTTDAGFYYAPLPPILNGNQPTTSYNFTAYNAGLLPTLSPWNSDLYLDDDLRVPGFTLEQIPAHVFLYWVNTDIGPWWSEVRGGRHYLRSYADIDNNIAEYNETDNEFTDWFVWSPLELANHAYVARSAPPYAYPTGAIYPAGDGFRSTLVGGSYWTAVAEMPAYMSAEYDMLLHAPSAGSKDGFGDYLAWSFDSFQGNPDFCIVNYNAAPFQQYDFSVTNQWNYGAPFYVQQANAPYELYLGSGVTRLGPFTLGAHDIIDLHEFYVPPNLVGVPTYISANNVSGGVDLELWLFDGTVPYHTKFTAMAGVNASGPGGDEHLPAVVFPYSGYYALAVNKSKATDMGAAANYELVFSTGQSIVGAPAMEALPTAFGLSSPRPNPSSAGTSVELAVPAGAQRASVVVYDLAGRRVRSLAEGNMVPGRHVLTWDGRDVAGRKVAAGVYFVKLDAPHVQETKKVTLLR